MTLKARISATVDGDVVQAGRKAVAEGRAGNLSEWINEALRDRAEHDRRMRAMDDFLAEYEREHGVITEEEMSTAAGRLRRRTTEVGPVGSAHLEAESSRPNGSGK